MTTIRSIDTNIELEQLRNEANAVRKQLHRIAADRDKWFQQWQRAHVRLVHVRLLLRELKKGGYKG